MKSNAQPRTPSVVLSQQAGRSSRLHQTIVFGKPEKSRFEAQKLLQCKRIIKAQAMLIRAYEKLLNPD